MTKIDKRVFTENARIIGMSPEFVIDWAISNRVDRASFSVACNEVRMGIASAFELAGKILNNLPLAAK